MVLNNNLMMLLAKLSFLLIMVLHASDAFGMIVRNAGFVSQSSSNVPRFMASSNQAEQIFAPLQSFFDSIMTSMKSSSSAAGKVVPGSEFDKPIEEALNILYSAAESKAEDTNKVFTALVDLERLQRLKRKAEAEATNDIPVTAQNMLRNLNGEWRLIFTTGTQDMQSKLGGSINYVPIKAVQTFDPSVEPMKITNGIYVGDFAVLKFYGDFQFDLKKCKLEFDFDQVAIFGFMINLGKGKAAEIGAASGLGSQNNVKMIADKKKPFFNWISADKKIATARGGGGGLALWKKIVPDGKET